MQSDNIRYFQAYLPESSQSVWNNTFVSSNILCIPTSFDMLTLIKYLNYDIAFQLFKVG